MTKQNQTMDARIAAILADDGKPTSSGDMEILVAEIGDAIKAEEATAQQERNKSLDAATPSADAEVAHKNAGIAELRAQRLKVVLPRIEQRLREAVATDIRDRCLVQRAEIEKKLNSAVEAFREYPSLVDRLVEIFDIAAAVDREVEHFNYTKADGVQRLVTTELLARELGGFGQYNPSIAANCVLPRWSCSSEDVWPRHRSSVNNIASLMFSAPAHRGADWHKGNAARDEMKAKEAARLNAYYDQMNAAKEQQQKDEIAAARAAMQQRR